jgi:predicted sulfurtransferase
MFLNAAFYQFVPWPAHRAAKPELLASCRALGLKGTILVSPEGINGSLCGDEASVRLFLEELRQMPEFERLRTRETGSEGPSFERLKVKIKKQIISMGEVEADPLQGTGRRLSAGDLKRWLDEARDVLLVDTRNAFEVKAGTFRGALNLELGHFHDFPNRVERIRQLARGRPVVMFCTGGIRCERATALALKQGMSDVYQLDGGILGYFECCGSSHYDGSCFVFDERETLLPREAKCS